MYLEDTKDFYAILIVHLYSMFTVDRLIFDVFICSRYIFFEMFSEKLMISKDIEGNEVDGID